MKRRLARITAVVVVTGTTLALSPTGQFLALARPKFLR